MTVRSFSRLEMRKRLTAHKLAGPVWARFWRFRSARMAAPRSFELQAGLMALSQFLRTTKFLAKCSKFARTQKSQGPLVAGGGYSAISMVSPGAMAPPAMTLQNTPSRGMMQSPTWW